MIENPIISGCNPDPSILRVGDAYYVATSTFEWFPGIPIYKSYDLEHWELVNHALTKVSQADLKGMDSATGVWAPALSYCEATKDFYITYSIVLGFNNNNFDIDNYAVVAKDIEGEFSDAIYLNSSGFDPSMFHDEDGRSYLVSLQWEFRVGYEHPGVIIVQEYDKSSKTLIGEPSVISKGATDRGCAEGPHIYKRNGYYYLIIAEGGTGYGHCITISRATNVFGPYIPYEFNPIITSQPNDFNERGIGDSAKPWQYSEGYYLQKSGHGSIVETPYGETFITHLCSRPFVPELRSVLGRETSIQACEWTEDGWIKLKGDDNIAKQFISKPNIPDEIKNQAIKDIRIANSGLDEFDNKVLANNYYTLREQFSEDWCSINEDNTLRLVGRNTLFSKYKQSIVARKVKDFNYTASTRMKIEDLNHLQLSGLTLYYNHNNFYALHVYYSERLGGRAIGILKGDNGKRIEYREDSILLPSTIDWIDLKLKVEGRNMQFYYATSPNKWIAIGPVLDTTILSDEYAGGFTGTFVGVFAWDLYQKSKIFTFDNFSYIDKTY